MQLTTSDITDILAKPLTSYVPIQFKINEAVNKYLDNHDMQQYSCGDESDFNDYTQFVTPGTHTSSNGDSVNNVNEQKNYDTMKCGNGRGTNEVHGARYQHITCSMGNILHYPQSTVWHT